MAATPWVMAVTMSFFWKKIPIFSGSSHPVTGSTGCRPSCRFSAVIFEPASVTLPSGPAISTRPFAAGTARVPNW